MAPSTQQQFQRLATLFEQAVGVPPGPEREAFLLHVCAGDAGLHEEISRLIQSDSHVQTHTSAPAPRPARFGAYQARDLIGRGGMGAVYRATREDGEIRQEVAIKVIVGSMSSPLLDASFRRERQILAELQHPNIARFLDGGIAEDGSLYLAMEYVVGDRIDVWCDRNQVPIRGRLEVFLKACAAVSFAHQKLIVHRDLKPANIIVSDDGEPKLLDFGIARALDPVGDGMRTMNAGLFFTPLYASPEMLRGQATGVGCDIYSLGVLLYELVSGRRPFGGANTTTAAIIESVLSTDAPRASAAVPETAEVAAARGAASPEAVRRAIRGDLDAIAAKALAKSPVERYLSVEQLAEDIRRYLSGHPVQAASAGSLYRARKFVLRNKARVAAAGVIAIGLMAGFVGTLWQAHVARQERAAAERRFNEAEELARYLVFELQRSVERLPGSTPLRAEMVSRSLTYLDRLAGEKSADEKLRTEVAHGYLELADVMGNPALPNIGEPVKAREYYGKAIALLEPIAARSVENREARLFLARSKLMLGRSIGSSAQSASEGRKLVEAAVKEFGLLAAHWPSDFQVRTQAAIAYDLLARTIGFEGGYVSTGSLEPALDAGQQSAEHAQAALRIQPGDFGSIRQLSTSYKVMGDLTELRDRPAATPYFQKAVAALDQLAPGDRQIPTARGTRASALLGLGWNLGNLGHYPEGLRALEEARQIRDRLSDEDPKNTMALFFRTIPYRDLAIVHQMAGQASASLENFLAAIAVYDRMLAKSPTNHGYRFARAELQASAGNLCIRLGRIPEGQRLASESQSFLKETARSGDANPVELAIAARSLIESEVRSLRDYKLALQFIQGAAAKNGQDSEIQEILGEAYWQNGDRGLAIQAVERALSLIEQGPTPARQALEKTLTRYRTERLP